VTGVLRVGACQTPEFIGDVDAAIACIRDLAAEAAPSGADLLVFPECFLQGYLVDAGFLDRWAIRLGSPEFAAIARRLADLAPTLVVGLIERGRDRILNTVVVLRAGEVVGAYRKTKLTAAEEHFAPGDEYPVFAEHGVRYGINICYDANFPDAAGAVAAQDADLLLLPAQNMMRRANAELWKDRHNEIRSRRAVETGMWLVSADVTGARDPERIGWGPTCVLDPRGEVVAQVPLGSVGVVTADIPARQRP
jgi:predicted amidohydrolase